jgi:hypothetical protein
MPAQGFNNESFESFPIIDGFLGPYRNQYLKGIALGAGTKKFTNLEEAVRASKENNRCGGITINRQGFYTLRRPSNLYRSDVQNKFKSIEVTYVKQPVLPEEPKTIKETNQYIIEECPKKHSVLEEIYEIIKFQNLDYYYNSKTRTLLDMEGEKQGILVRGKLVK